MAGGWAGASRVRAEGGFQVGSGRVWGWPSGFPIQNSQVLFLQWPKSECATAPLKVATLTWAALTLQGNTK